MINTLKFFGLIVVLTVSFSGQGAVWSINYPRALSDDDKRNEYPLKVLEMALEATGVRYTLLPSEKILLQEKAIRQLKENRDINIFWGMTDKQREDDLLPIRIPIYKGLIGWRVAFIREGDIESFSGVTSLRTLQNLDAIQGRDWPDTKILQANGFNVLTTRDYQDALEKLNAGEGHFFPRSVIEILGERDKLAKDSVLIIDEEFILHYPSAAYFFVNKADLILARLIETGLRSIIDSGEFDKHFNAQFSDVLQSLDITDRQVFRLSNPLLSNEAPLNNSAMWFTLPVSEN